MNNDTSWEKSSKWYNGIVGSEGQYYHQAIVIPKTLKLLGLKPGDSLIDLGCGQGVMGRQMQQGVTYQGLDLSPSLIAYAQRMDKAEDHNYRVADVTKNLPIKKYDFSHATIILAMQNMANAFGVMANASNHLKEGGKLIIVLNHPVFRIPKQTSWQVDRENKIQYRRINKYMTPLKIEIVTNPGKADTSESTWSFHHSIADYSKMIRDAGLMIEQIEEWVSDKKSTGPMAAMEDTARKEIPLFMAIVCRKSVY